jgi:hypothetical protein
MDRRFKRNLAMSQMLATIILIVTTLVAGSIAYYDLSGYTNTFSRSGQFSINEVSLHWMFGGKGLFALNCTNSGSLTTKSISVVLNGYPTFSYISPINPGQSWGNYTVVSYFQVVQGNSYTVVLSVQYSDGSSSNSLTSVLAQ